MNKDKEVKAPPEIGPYVFPAVLAALGIWCLYDGFFSTDPEMQEYLLFNRIAGIALTGWAIIDSFRTWKSELKQKESDDKE